MIGLVGPHDVGNRRVSIETVRRGLVELGKPGQWVLHRRISSRGSLRPPPRSARATDDRTGWILDSRVARHRRGASTRRLRRVRVDGAHATSIENLAEWGGSGCGRLERTGSGTGRGRHVTDPHTNGHDVTVAREQSDLGTVRSGHSRSCVGTSHGAGQRRGIGRDTRSLMIDQRPADLPDGDRHHRHERDHGEEQWSRLTLVRADRHVSRRRSTGYEMLRGEIHPEGGTVTRPRRQGSAPPMRRSAHRRDSSPARPWHHGPAN